MRRRIFALYLIPLTLLVAVILPRLGWSSWLVTGADADLRAPFSLELPEAGGLVITAPETSISTSDLHTLRLRVHKPYADTINYGKIYTKINGESAGVIQNPGRDRDDHILLTLNLDTYPRFKLQPGKNVIEIQAIDRNNRSYYASYVLLAGANLDNVPGSAAGATMESVPVTVGDDRQPPTIYLTNPSSAARLLRTTRALTVQGVATDDSGSIASVAVNGQPARLSPAIGARLLVPVSAKTPSASLDFERSITIGANVSALVVEAKDRAGNLTRLTLPLNLKPPPPPSTGGFTGRRFAVIIGVSRYRDESIRNLEFADADARALRNFLERREGGGFAPNDILYLENEQATSEAVNSALDRFLLQAKKEDLLLFYIAGHGGPDPYTPQNLYYVLHDTKVSDLSHTALRMTALQEKLDQVRAERMLVFIDTCHSAGLGGQQPEGTRSLENNLINLYSARLFKEKGRAVLTSSDVNEPSRENKRWGGGHGIFTFALLEGLRGEADANTDRLITAGELFAYVRDRVRLETGFKQNPRALYDLNSDMALAFVAGK